MNRPCIVHFHEDTAPLLIDLPERYRANVVNSVGVEGGGDHQYVLSLAVQHAFYIDYAPNILRTRVGGTKEEDPVDFFQPSISFIEWYYGTDVPPQLTPQAPSSRRN